MLLLLVSSRNLCVVTLSRPCYLLEHAHTYILTSGIVTLVMTLAIFDLIIYKFTMRVCLGYIHVGSFIIIHILLVWMFS